MGLTSTMRGKTAAVAACAAALLMAACGGGGSDAPAQHRYAIAYVNNTELRYQADVGGCESFVDRLRAYVGNALAPYRWDCTDAPLATPLPWYSIVDMNNGQSLAMRSPTQQACTASVLNLSGHGRVVLACTMGPP